MNEMNLRLKASGLFSQAGCSGKSLNALSTIALYFLLWLVGMALGRVLAWIILLIPVCTISESVTCAVRRITVCGIQILTFILWVRFIEKRSIQSLGLQARRPIVIYLTGFMIGLVAIVMIAAALAMLGVVRFEYRYSESFASIGNIGVMALGWMVQSASEEIAIRGWLIPRIGNRHGPIMALLSTAAVFGVLHLFSDGVTALSFINLVLSGLVFAGYAIYSETIWGVCGLHFAWNFALGSVFGFPVSGFVDNTQTVLRAHITGAALFTGGEFGPEGGLITTVILLIALGVLGLLLYHKYASAIDVNG